MHSEFAKDYVDSIIIQMRIQDIPESVSDHQEQILLGVFDEINEMIEGMKEGISVRIAELESKITKLESDKENNVNICKKCKSPLSFNEYKFCDGYCWICNETHLG